MREKDETPKSSSNGDTSGGKSPEKVEGRPMVRTIKPEDHPANDRKAQE